MSNTQPAYDFSSDGLKAEEDYSSLRESFKQSVLSQPVRADARNEDLRAQINSLQYELDSLRQDREVTLLHHQQELRDAEARAEADFKRAQAAEAKAASATGNQSTILREMQESLTRAENEKSSLERKARTLTEQANQLREEIDELQESVAAVTRESEHKISEIESRAKTAQTAFEALRTELDAKSKSLQESQHQIVRQETELEELRKEVADLKENGADSQELQVVKREFSEQVELVRNLEIKTREQQVELKRLRERNTSIEILQEEKRNLETKVRMMDELRIALSEAEVRREVLEDERRSWASYIERQTAREDETDIKFDSPEEMARAFMKLRIENVSLLDKVGTLRPELATQEDEVRRLEDKVEKLEAEVEELKTKGSAVTPSTESAGTSIDRKLMVRLERQKALAVKEVEYLRAQLQAFDTEQLETGPDEKDEGRAAMIRDLQALVDEHRAEMEEARKQLAELAAAAKAGDDVKPAMPVADVGSKRKRISSGLDDYDKMVELRQLNRELAEKVSELELKHRETEAELEAQVSQLQALRESSRTRVLQLRDNPTAEAEGIKMATLRLLRAENQALLAQLAGESPGGSVSGSDAKRPARTLVPAESVDALRDELDQLQAEIGSKEKRNNRRMQVFASKAAEFREAVASILGWKMDFMPNGRVKVTSMFYPGDDEQERSIVFDGENGTMKVSGGPRSEFATEIRSLIEFWVEGKKEIPCFLAAMTLEFYDRFTRTS